MKGQQILVAFVTTDREAAMKLGVTLFLETDDRSDCFAHVIQSCVKLLLTKSHAEDGCTIDCPALVAKVRKAVAKVRNSSKVQYNLCLRCLRGCLSSPNSIDGC
jgi:hypothetical protein